MRYGSELWKLRAILRDTNEGGGGGVGDTGAGGGGGGTPDDGASGGQTDPPTYDQLVEQHKTAKEGFDKLSADLEAARIAKLTPEEKAAEEKAKADADAEAALSHAPESYDAFTVPEGMELDSVILDKAQPLFKELNLSQGKAQQVVDMYAKEILPEMQKRQAEAWQDTLKGWQEQAKGDKEIGGDKFDQSISDAKRVVNTLGTPELKEAFDQYGLGNHPELVRVFARMAKYLKEDSFESGGRTQQATAPGSKLWPDLPKG